MYLIAFILLASQFHHRGIKIEIRLMDQSKVADFDAEEIDPVDCFKILLATGTHLGYNEKDIDNWINFLYIRTVQYSTCRLNLFIISSKILSALFAYRNDCVKH